MKSITVNVTVAHTKNGVRRVRGMCALALALTDAGLVRPIVTSTTVTHGNYMGTRFTHQLPTSARRCVEAFDAGKWVEPFTFTLELPV